jgi:hypothetical protein
MKFDPSTTAGDPVPPTGRATLLTVGGDTKFSVRVASLPAGVVTAILTEPLAWLGAVTFTSVGETTVTDWAGVPPKLTETAP